MLSSRSSAVLRQSARLATQRHASTLVLAEHDNNKLSPVMITTSAVAVGRSIDFTIGFHNHGEDLY